MKKWTVDDQELLETKYQSMGADWCAERMGRSRKAVVQKASKMGLRASPDSPGIKKRRESQANALRGRKRPGHSDLMKKLMSGDGASAWKEHVAEAGRKRKGMKKLGPAAYRGVCGVCGVSFYGSRRQKRCHAEACKGAPLHGEHPMGMKGKRHSDDAKRRMSFAQKERFASMSADEKSLVAQKALATRQKNGWSPPSVGRSWKAGWREVGASRCFFRSRWEANYARYLELLRVSGKIDSWEFEPETFWFEGVRRGCVSYKPDFRVVRDGRTEYHEVKGWMCDRSRVTLKRMAKYYPDVTVLVIDGKAYRRLQRSVASVIHSWET